MAAVASLAAAARAQTEAPRDPRSVMPERPTVATHAYTVAPGYLEIEAGVEADRFDDGSRVFQVLSNSKIGLASHLQLNVQVPLDGGSPATSGPGDASLGVKWRVADHDGLLGSFAVLPALKLPTGSNRLGRGTGTTDETLTLISSRDVRGVSLDLNVAWTHRSGDGSAAPRDAWLWTVSTGGTIRGPLGFAAEWFGYPATGGPSGQSGWSALLIGPTCVVARSAALDAGAILPLSGSQSLGLYAGITWNAGRIAGSGLARRAG